MERLCVFCGSNNGLKMSYVEGSYILVEELKKRKIRIVYGGGKVGLMGAISAHAKFLGVQVTGVMPKFLIDKEIANNEIDQLIEVEGMHERKQKMLDISDGFIMIPGGLGTFEEFFEILSWSQMGLHKKPIGILNINNFFDPMIEMINNAIHEGFAPKENLDLICIDNNANELLNKMYDYNHTLPNKYNN